jgi:hypothetical protein
MPSTTTAPAHRPEWSPLLRFGFRVAFVFFVLDSLPRLIESLPGGEKIPSLDGWLMRWLVPWVGQHVLHLPRAITVLGGWDTAFGYVREFCRLALALSAAAAWTVVDRRRREYHILHYWLRVLLRYEVALSVLYYGTAKVFQMQFPTPDLTVLMAPMGTQTPHILLWNFMGFSRTYQIFTGCLECGGALLLIFRRTTTIGAFLIAAAMANVAVMDLSYRTFVMMIAVHLLLGAAFLTVPDLPRLAKVLVLRRPVPDATDDGPRFRGWLKWAAAAVQTATFLYLTLTPGLFAYRTSRSLARSEATPPLYGLYRVEKFLRNGREVPPEEPGRWQLVAIDGASKTFSGFEIRQPDESWEWRRSEYDPAKSTVTLSDNKEKSILEYTRSADTVALKGPLGGAAVEITLGRIPPPRFALNDPAARRWVARW